MATAAAYAGERQVAAVPNPLAGPSTRTKPAPTTPDVPLPVPPTFDPLERVNSDDIARGRVRFHLYDVTVPEAVAALYKEVLSDTPFVLPPEVQQDGRKVSLRIDADRAGARRQALRYMAAMGVRVVETGGVDRVELDPGKDVLLYRPKWRSASYLQSGVAGLCAGERATSGPSPQNDATSAAGAAQSATSTSSATDVVTCRGLPADLRRARKMLSSLDIPLPQVQVRLWVWEVTLGDGEGGALQLVAGPTTPLGAVGVSLGQASPLATGSSPGAQGISLSSAKYGSVLLSWLAGQQRARLLTNPTLVAASGTTSRFTAGESVPTLGGTSYQGASGTAVQNIAYQDSGVVMSITPDIHGDTVDLDLHQQISSFVATTNGVNNTPTKNTREVTDRLNLKFGDMALLSGLRSSSTQKTDNEVPYLHIPLGRTEQRTDTEILVLVQIERAGVRQGLAQIEPSALSTPLRDEVAISRDRLRPQWQKKHVTKR